MNDDSWLRSGIGRSTPDSITIRGRDLATELMGKVTFSELAFFLTALAVHGYQIWLSELADSALRLKGANHRQCISTHHGNIQRA